MLYIPRISIEMVSLVEKSLEPLKPWQERKKGTMNMGQKEGRGLGTHTVSIGGGNVRSVKL